MPRIISRLSLSQKPWELVSKVNKFGINLKLHSSALTFRKQNAFSFIRLAARPAKRSALDLADFYPQGQSRLVVAETKTVGVVPKSTKNPQCVVFHNYKVKLSETSYNVVTRFMEEMSYVFSFTFFHSFIEARVRLGFACSKFERKIRDCLQSKDHILLHM